MLLIAGATRAQSYSRRNTFSLVIGDVLVAEARTLPKSDQPASVRQHMVASGSIGVSPNRIMLLRDRDGVAETRSVFLDNLNQPFGMTSRQNLALTDDYAMSTLTVAIWGKAAAMCSMRDFSG
jgi:glucose/arabinose dehydrogenase